MLNYCCHCCTHHVPLHARCYLHPIRLHAQREVTHLDKVLPGSFSCAGSRALAAGGCPLPGSLFLRHLYLPAQLSRMPLLGLGSILCLQSPFASLPLHRRATGRL